MSDYDKINFGGVILNTETSKQMISEVITLTEKIVISMHRADAEWLTWFKTYLECWQAITDLFDLNTNNNFNEVPALLKECEIFLSYQDIVSMADCLEYQMKPHLLLLKRHLNDGGIDSA
jgi:hypothetical protein